MEKDNNPSLLGHVVTLKSHPYFQGLTSTIIAGDPLQIPPLMIVVEQVIDTKDHWDEQTGDQLAEKNITSQCKCIWYSHKSHGYVDALISSKLLKTILQLRSLSKSDLKIGSQVTLKSFNLETGKIKSAFRTDRSNNEIAKETSSSTAFLNFAPPIMQVIGFKENEIKEPTYDIKTGQKKKIISSCFVKCKWFNSENDKLSEILLPIESLSKIPEISEDLITQIQTVIDEDKFLIINPDSEAAFIGKPQKVIYLAGYYFVSIFDYISNKMRFNILISGTERVVNDFYVSRAPKFSLVDKLSLEQSNLDLAKESRKANSYLRIKYENRQGVVSVRTVKNYDIKETTEIVQGNEMSISYLDGYCCSKKAQRHFRFDRIEWVEQLNLEFPVKG